MEKITYRKTLDVHKNGSQFLLQGFETADKMSRVIEISLMASGDAIDFPLESISAVMYVTTPGTDGPSINECTIKDNKVVYEVLPIVEEGITTMQLKLIETSPEGAKSVLASPKFTVEVHKSEMDEEEAEHTVTYTAIENAIAMAKEVHAHHLNRIELSSDLMFRAYYEDATTYETDVIKQIFFKDEGFTTLSKSYAVGDTGARTGEDIDNSKYYSNVAKSEASKAKYIMENSEDMLEEARLQGIYTAFSVDFNTGEVEYVSPSFKFDIDPVTGELDAIGQSYTFYEEIGRVVVEWLENNNVAISDLQKHANMIAGMQQISSNHSGRIETLEKRITPIEKGGTGASTKEDAIVNLGINNYQMPWNVDENIVRINYNNAMIKAETVRGDVDETREPVTKDLNIFMKNSGNVYLAFDVLEGRPDNDCERSVNLFINNVEQSFSYKDKNKILLTVKKGDIVTIRVSVYIKWGSGSPMDTCSITARDIRLLANAETPYTYFTLEEDDTSMPETIENVLNDPTETID